MVDKKRIKGLELVYYFSYSLNVNFLEKIKELSNLINIFEIKSDVSLIKLLSDFKESISIEKVFICTLNDLENEEREVRLKKTREKSIETNLLRGKLLSILTQDESSILNLKILNEIEKERYLILNKKKKVSNKYLDKYSELISNIKKLEKKKTKYVKKYLSIKKQELKKDFSKQVAIIIIIIILLILSGFKAYEIIVFYIKLIIDERERAESIYNSQEAIVVIIENKVIAKVNNLFFKTFGYETLENFLKYHKCICEIFEDKKDSSFINGTMVNGKYWLEHLIEIKEMKGKVNKVSMIGVDGKERVYEVKLKKNEGLLSEKIEQYILVFSDVTELTAQYNQLQKTEKLSMLGEMIGMIAHQWKQPLNTVSAIFAKINMKRAFGELSDKDWEESFKKHELIIKSLSKTIDDFLSFFNENEIKIEEVKIEEILKTPYSILEALIKKSSVEFEFDFINEKVNIRRTRLDQVLTNVYKNSIDALIENKIKNPKIIIKAEKKKGDLVISVIDNAGGIPVEIMNNIFEPYFSTKSKNGTGLGLYMSIKIIEEQLKGRMIATNNEDGAIFKIYIPLIN